MKYVLTVFQDWEVEIFTWYQCTAPLYSQVGGSGRDEETSGDLKIKLETENFNNSHYLPLDVTSCKLTETKSTNPAGRYVIVSRGRVLFLIRLQSPTNLFQIIYFISLTTISSQICFVTNNVRSRLGTTKFYPVEY